MGEQYSATIDARPANHLNDICEVMDPRHGSSVASVINRDKHSPLRNPSPASTKGVQVYAEHSFSNDTGANALIVAPHHSMATNVGGASNTNN